MTALTLAAALLASPARAGDDAKPPGDWRAQAKDERLTPDEIERLAATKLLVAGPEYRQVFEPYDRSNVPTFVTSDSVLNAYHVLFEESVARMERARAARLASVLRPFWDGIPEATTKLDLPADALADVVRRAQVTVGVALRLLGADTPGASKETTETIAEEAALVTRAEGRVFPRWCGTPDDGFPFLDYGRFRPRGFYVRDRRLAAYFRATSWLQAIPLRFGNERELFTAVLLAEALASVRGAEGTYDEFTSAWDALLGTRGDVSVEKLVQVQGRWTRENVGTFRDWKTERWGRRNGEGEGNVEAVSAVGPAAPALHGLEPGMRVLPAAQTPDGLLFDACCPPCDVPSGLFVAAALGGGFARREALRGRPDGVAKRVASACDDARPADGKGLYASYLRCIAALLDAPEPDAPKLFASDAWQAKSTNAALAGWAQLRHTWVLQAREDANWMGIEETVPGFVEPDPTFFARLADLVAASFELFEAQGAFEDSLDRDELRLLLADYAAFLRAGGGKKTRRELETTDELALVLNDRCAWFVERLGGPRPRWNYEIAMSGDDVTKALDVAEEAVRLLEGDAPLPGRLKECVAGNVPPFRHTWRALERVCRRVEAMAHKQLRGAPWTAEEAEFLREYGHVLAAAMFYGGNAYESPRDDAPRATSVFADLRDAVSPSYFQVAVGRPRALYALYPWKDGEVLCRGAVMPYREFVRDRRLTDAEWAKLAGSADAPPSPEWMAPITAPVRPKAK